ncbi:MAG: YlxR family protein [Lachnospiraceae bacterium]|jgi:predicted RNA-binding protein YlxR (DUF448 family)|nr:YlxR family protein [Lachnospiraceae bacterium]MCR5426822.1 YlxR family protein [Lachnospiraceae bacterium]
MEKKKPLRTCVGCGQQKDKKELIRVLRAADGSFLLDATGRANGRGAYLCPDADCLMQAQKRKGLERSFRQPIPAEVYRQLSEELGRLSENE